MKVVSACCSLSLECSVNINDIICKILHLCCMSCLLGSICHFHFSVLTCAFHAFNSDQESCSDNNAGCTHGCIQGPFGAQCTCPVGYQLSNDSKTCEDIDECNPLGLCSQQCFNERGSYRCHCLDGYTLEADQRTCKASGKEGLCLKPFVHGPYCSLGRCK